MRAYRVRLEHKSSDGWIRNYMVEDVMVQGGATRACAKAVRQAEQRGWKRVRAESVELIADDQGGAR